MFTTLQFYGDLKTKYKTLSLEKRNKTLFNNEKSRVHTYIHRGTSQTFEIRSGGVFVSRLIYKQF